MKLGTLPTAVDNAAVCALVCCFVGLIAGCLNNADNDLAICQRAVAEFHGRLDAGEFDVIYQTASEAFRRSSPRDRITGFFETVRAKLGTVQQSTIVHSNVTYRSSQQEVTLTYSIKFERGVASEVFVFELLGAEPRLVRYEIRSDALL